MNIFGIGPRLALSGGAGAGAVFLLRRYAGWTLPAPVDWVPMLQVAGAIFLLAGLWFWAGSVVHISRACRVHELATGGVYGLCRNPMYAAFIVFILPGLALAANEFLVLVVALGMFFEFQRKIGREEESLRREFGAAYEKYAREVPRLLPRLRGQRRPAH